MNTAIHYIYRDFGGNRARRTEVIAGQLEPGQIGDFLSKYPYDTDDGLAYFLPGQVGLPWGQQEFIEKTADPEYNYHFPGDEDHPWCVLDALEPTSDKPTLKLTAEELLENFRKVKWDEDAAKKELGWACDPLGKPWS